MTVLNVALYGATRDDARLDDLVIAINLVAGELGLRPAISSETYRVEEGEDQQWDTTGDLLAPPTAG